MFWFCFYSRKKEKKRITSCRISAYQGNTLTGKNKRLKSLPEGSFIILKCVWNVKKENGARNVFSSLNHLKMVINKFAVWTKRHVFYMIKEHFGANFYLWCVSKTGKCIIININSSLVTDCLELMLWTWANIEKQKT